MSDERELEHFLEQVSVPNLREGPHRQRLKAELSDSTERSQRQEEQPIKANGRFEMTRLMRVAAGVLIAAFLVATGWAAEKVYQKVIRKSYVVELEKQDLPPVKLPDEVPENGNQSGSTMSMSATFALIPEDAQPGSVEKVKADHARMKQLIAEKKYELIRSFERPPGGPKQYVYRFTLPTGEHWDMNFSLKLENVASWDDYLQKNRKQVKQRNEQISEAIAAGNFRLLDVAPITIHVCEDVDSNQRLLVQRIELPDGEEIASVRGETAGVPQYQTSWRDHLESIRQHERVLLNLQIIENYTYEITLYDASTTIFTYGGDGPLKKPPG